MIDDIIKKKLATGVISPDGIEDLGDVDELDIGKILDEERETVKDVITYFHKREIANPKGQEYKPVVRVDGIGEVHGKYRIGQHYLDGEREMLTQQIANMLSGLIWGVDMFVTRQTPKGVKFKINPKFRRLPVINTPKNLQEVADATFEAALPLQVFDEDGTEDSLYTVTEVISWDQVTEMPYMIEVCKFDDNRRQASRVLYTPVNAEPMEIGDEDKETSIIQTPKKGITLM